MFWALANACQLPPCTSGCCQLPLARWVIVFYVVIPRQEIVSLASPHGFIWPIHCVKECIYQPPQIGGTRELELGTVELVVYVGHGAVPIKGAKFHNYF